MLKFIIMNLLVTILINAVPISVLAFTIFYLILVIFKRPSNNRNWSPDQAVLPEISRNGNIFHIKNVRNFIYRGTSDYTPHYYDQTYDIAKLTGARFIVEPFHKFNAAHTMLSFEFSNEKKVTISPEIRKKKGELFSAFKGLFRYFELMFVIADEADTIKLRTNFRRDTVYLYPITLSTEKLRKLFVYLMERSRNVQQKPEFFNTITNTCFSNLAREIRKVSDKKIFMFDTRVIMPANSDKLLQKIGLIQNNSSIANLRKKYYITKKAQKCPEGAGFSEKIRS